jgi:hypothetical protein
MQALILIGALLIPPAVTAGESTLLSLHRSGKRLEEFTRIVEKSGQWHCETEIIPFFPLAGRPDLGPELKRIAASPAKQSCEEWVAASFSQERGRPTTITACGDDPEVRALLARAAALCGRN